MVSSSALFYFFEGVICIASALKLLYSYRETKNIITKYFVIFLFFLFLFFFSSSVPALLAPENNFLLNLFSIIGEVFIFIGFAFGMRSFVMAQFEKIPPNLASATTILTGLVVVYLNLSIFGSSFLDAHGVIEWNLHPIAIVIYATTIIFLMSSLAFEFFRTAIKNREIRLRSLFLGTAVVFCGMGGTIVIMHAGWQWLLWGHQLLALGLALVGVVFFFIPAAQNKY